MFACCSLLLSCRHWPPPPPSLLADSVATNAGVSARRTMIILISVVLALAIGQLPSSTQAASQAQQQQQSLSPLSTSSSSPPPPPSPPLIGSNNGSNPYWRRPGCHRVGHTRTISIPGCVKFNLSTNACRGYCMSYSIPANEEEADAEAELAPAEPGASFYLHELTSEPQQQQPRLKSKQQQQLEQGNSQLLATGGGGGDGSGHKSSPQIVSTLYELPVAMKPSDLLNMREPHAAPSPTLSQGGGGHLASQLANHLGQQPHLQWNQGQAGHGSKASPLDGSNASEGPNRRGLVSVSQCCSMMDTEDVVVNLRCGANELRRLVFKSAKTCECFFCKHV